MVEQDETLIAFYASNLDSDRAVESYAQFLFSQSRRCLASAGYLFAISSIRIRIGPSCSTYCSAADTRSWTGSCQDRVSNRRADSDRRPHGKFSLVSFSSTPLIAGHPQETAKTEANATLDVYVRLDDRQIELIRSLEWLTIDPSTHAHAITQANALVRYFLGQSLRISTFCDLADLACIAASAKPHAAKELLLQFPSDVLPGLAASVGNGTSIEGIAAEITEYYDFVAFFECLEKHTRFSETWSVKPRSSCVLFPLFSRSTLMIRAVLRNWITLRSKMASLYVFFIYCSAARLKNCTADSPRSILLLHDGFVGVGLAQIEFYFDRSERYVTTTLCIRLLTPSPGHRKAAELARIRQLYIPELILRLHFSLFETRSYIPTFVSALSCIPTTLTQRRIGICNERSIWRRSLRTRNRGCISSLSRTSRTGS